MDDFTVSGLHESKNEWGARLLVILTPHIIVGLRSVLEESVKLCSENDEMEKYLMTFQNFITRIPKWNSEIIANETARIIEKSGCNYLEDLITCVHVIQLKILTAVRVGQKPKKVDIDVMHIHDFIHKTYINAARQVYKNVYLFDLNVSPLQTQKHNRELEVIVQECILNTIRESIPVQAILKCYLDESTEDDIAEEVREEDITPEEEPVEHLPAEQLPVTLPASTPASIPDTVLVSDTEPLSVTSLAISPEVTVAATATTLTFNDVDSAVDYNKNEYTIDAPKNIERLEEISKKRNDARRQEEEDEENEGKLSISTESIKLDDMCIHTIDDPMMDIKPSIHMNDIEILA